MLSTKPIPGQEEANAHFVQRMGAGHVAGTEEELRCLLSRFLSNPEDLEKLREKAAVTLPDHSTERVVKYMLQISTNLENEQKIDKHG